MGPSPTVQTDSNIAWISEFTTARLRIVTEPGTTVAAHTAAGPALTADDSILRDDDISAQQRRMTETSKVSLSGQSHAQVIAPSPPAAIHSDSDHRVTLTLVTRRSEHQRSTTSTATHHSCSICEVAVRNSEPHSAHAEQGREGCSQHQRQPSRHAQQGTIRAQAQVTTG